MFMVLLGVGLFMVGGCFGLCLLIDCDLIVGGLLACLDWFVVMVLVRLLLGRYYGWV